MAKTTSKDQKARRQEGTLMCIGNSDLRKPRVQRAIGSSSSFAENHIQKLYFSRKVPVKAWYELPRSRLNEAGESNEKNNKLE